MFLFFFYIILSPPLWLILLIWTLFNSKLRHHYWNQKSSIHFAKQKIKNECNGRKIVIFHAASAGEYEQLKPILKKIDREKYFIVQTFFSPTIFIKESQSNLSDVVCYHPFDFPWSAAIFFTRISPSHYIITRHDIWPIHLFVANLLSIKCVMINANLYSSSNRFNPLLKSFNRITFRYFIKITTGSERMKSLLINFTHEDKIIVTGDSRFDQVIQRSQNSTDISFPEEFSQTNNIIFGSTLFSDLSIIETALSTVFPNGDESLTEQKKKLIIVPHEISDIDIGPIMQLLDRLDIKFSRFTDKTLTTDCNAIIIDKVGILADLYRFAKIAYIGGGFSTGVHSVIEPAIHGCATIFGPKIDILDEAITMHELGIGRMITSGEQLADFLIQMNNIDILDKLRKQNQDFVFKNGNVSDKIISEIFDV